MTAEEVIAANDWPGFSVEQVDAIRWGYGCDVCYSSESKAQTACDALDDLIRLMIEMAPRDPRIAGRLAKIGLETRETP